MILSTTLGVALLTTSGQAAAMNKAELIEAMASHAGLRQPDAQRVLDAFINATTKALKNNDSVELIGFGSFSISKRSARTGRNPRVANAPTDDSPVVFAPCPEFAAALDINPGRGDVASAKCDADVTIDAAYIASNSKLSKADAKKALDGFVNAITMRLKSGEIVSLGGQFGSFSISKRSARTGRNPQTGKEIQIPAKNVVKFKAGAELSKSVN